MQLLEQVMYTKLQKLENFHQKQQNVTIRKIAKKVAATRSGEFRIFCNTIAKIIVATGIAKNISKVFIRISPIQFFYIICNKF